MRQGVLMNSVEGVGTVVLDAGASLQGRQLLRGRQVTGSASACYAWYL